MFLAFARILKDCPSFQCHDMKQHMHFSHKLHLHVTMKYFGSQGNACSAISGKEPVLNCIDRTVAAILSLKSRSIFWPDAAE